MAAKLATVSGIETGFRHIVISRKVFGIERSVRPGGGQLVGYQPIAGGWVYFFSQNQLVPWYQIGWSP